MIVEYIIVLAVIAAMAVFMFPKLGESLRNTVNEAATQTQNTNTQVNDGSHIGMGIFIGIGIVIFLVVIVVAVMAEMKKDETKKEENIDEEETEDLQVETKEEIVIQEQKQEIKEKVEEYFPTTINELLEWKKITNILSNEILNYVSSILSELLSLENILEEYGTMEQKHAVKRLCEKELYTLLKNYIKLEEQKDEHKNTLIIALERIEDEILRIKKHAQEYKMHEFQKSVNLIFDRYKKEEEKENA